MCSRNSAVIQTSYIIRKSESDTYTEESHPEFEQSARTRKLNRRPVIIIQAVKRRKVQS